MTYLQFHAVFTLPVLAIFGWLAFRASRRGRPVAGWLTGSDRTAWLVLGAHVLVALVYTTPWDNYLVARGIWGYPEGRVWFTVGFVPIEEYLFFVIQTLVTGSILFWLARRGLGAQSEARDASAGVATRTVGAALLAAIAGGGAVALAFEQGTYLGLILVWATPVLALQWAFGGDLLARAWRLVVPAVALPTLWLWLADRLAIGAEIWWISEANTTGLALWGLPVEEAIFFLVTNLLVVFGVTLVLMPASWTRFARLRRAVASTPFVRWKAVLVLWALSMVPVPLLPGAFAFSTYASTALLALATLLFALERFGRKAWVMFLAAFAFGVAVEAIGHRTGIPFGAYAYGAPGPAILGVPVFVPLGWWAFTVIAISAAPFGPVVAVAPLILVAWDLGLDPLMVHHGFWRFEPAGSYAGVPWVNFAGWYAAGLVLVWILVRIEPGVRRVRSRALRAAFVAQAFLLTFGLAFFGLLVPAVVAAVAMGTVIASWRFAARRAVAVSRT